jgi:hypothetical protein
MAAGWSDGLEQAPLAQEGMGALWDPYLLVQVLIPFAAAALRAIMDATAVERLPGVTPGSLIMPPAQGDDPYGEPKLGRVMQLNSYRA